MGDEKMQTSQEIRRKWDREHSRVFGIRLYDKRDADIIEWLDSQENKSNAIRLLIEKELQQKK